jgi:hypothetical protein
MVTLDQDFRTRIIALLRETRWNTKELLRRVEDADLRNTLKDDIDESDEICDILSKM